MLPKKNRADKKTITKIFQNGKSFFSGHLSLKYIKNNSASTQLSFIAPKNIAKRAVDRNLLKRRGYCITKKYFQKLPPGFMGVLIFGKKSLEFFGGRKNKKYHPIQNLENEIKTIFYKIY